MGDDKISESTKIGGIFRNVYTNAVKSSDLYLICLDGHGVILLTIGLSLKTTHGIVQKKRRRDRWATVLPVRRERLRDLSRPRAMRSFWLRMTETAPDLGRRAVRRELPIDSHPRLLLVWDVNSSDLCWWNMPLQTSRDSFRCNAHPRQYFWPLNIRW